MTTVTTEELPLAISSEDAERLASAQEFLALPPPERAAVQEVVEAFRAAGVSPDEGSTTRSNFAALDPSFAARAAAG